MYENRPRMHMALAGVVADEPGRLGRGPDRLGEYVGGGLAHEKTPSGSGDPGRLLWATMRRNWALLGDSLGFAKGFLGGSCLLVVVNVVPVGGCGPVDELQPKPAPFNFDGEFTRQSP